MPEEVTKKSDLLKIKKKGEIEESKQRGVFNNFKLPPQKLVPSLLHMTDVLTSPIF